MFGEFITTIIQLFTEKVHFPVSGVVTYLWLPFIITLALSLLCAPAGVSGGVLLMPVQISLFNFVGPSVSSTNLMYNVVAIPLGVWSFARKKRVIGKLSLTIVLMAFPGFFLGAIVRRFWLLNPRHFKIFVGLVLLYIVYRLLKSVKEENRKSLTNRTGDFQVKDIDIKGKFLSYQFNSQTYKVNLIGLSILSFIIGIIGGSYGIGGGALMSPLLVTLYNLPVHSIAGTTLLSTWATSLGGIVTYILTNYLFPHHQIYLIPDWGLGFTFGLGGMAGIYIASHIQKFLPSRLIKVTLSAILLITAFRYISGY